MFQLLDLALQDLLMDASGPPPLAGVDVSFKRPDKVVSFADLTLDLFLYSVRENRVLRDPVPIIEWDNATMRFTRRRPPMRVDCDYLVTAWSKKQLDAAVEEEHKLLADALLKLSFYRVVPAAIVNARLPGQPFPVELWVAQEEDGKGLAEFWGSLGISPRASFHLMATVAMVYDVHEVEGPPVTTRTLVLDADLDVATPGEPIYSFGGTVTDAANAPVEAATVTLDGKRTALTDEDGRYVFTGVAAGAYTVDAVKGAAAASINITIPPDPNAVPAPTLTDFDVQI